MTDKPDEPNDLELRKLLPFYVNRTLDEQELANVEDYLIRSEEARGEVAYLQRLRQAVKGEPSETSPGKLGLIRLQRDIALGKGLQPASTAKTGKRASNLAREAQLSARGQGVTVWWRHLAIAACLTLAVMAGLSLATGQRRDDNPQLAGAGYGSELQITFKPQASEAAIRALLLETGLSIKEGPSSLGIYRLNTGALAGETLENVLKKLKQRRDVVETVEVE
ncbi:hypothetical protein [Pelagibius sp. Alg239-R121]|uniref:hypothetical protein n=1 Tax=Pelagibius sp. Alg239-R121 TaxID=2993448 RepID=UPI0024A77D43|nr:hypothetical protein [Pelagibius sp. Alg239-R121]